LAGPGNSEQIGFAANGDPRMGGIGLGPSEIEDYPDFRTRN